MTEIELIQDLKKKYSGKKFNEAEVRFKIIDEILEKYLKWPKNKTSVEVFHNGNRADYVLYNNSQKPVLIIESKKTGNYFELPTSINFKNQFEKITLEKLLTDKRIKEAVLQVKEYCEDLMCQYAAICNGEVWIIFKITSTNQNPWKKLPAYVIKSLDFFENDFTEAINFLGYTSVINKLSLQSLVGVSKILHPEIYFPSSSITAYDTLVSSNKYANSLSIISRKYLGIIPENDSEFMDSCYVSNKKQYENLQDNVQSFLVDSLTPYFKKLGFKDFVTENDGGNFGRTIVKTIRQENLDNVMILFGGRGSGKSTFLKRFLYHIRPIEIDMYSKIALIDLINSSQTSESLSNEIWDNVLKSIDINNIYNGERDDIFELFSEEYETYKKQFLFNLDVSSDIYNKLIIEFIQKCLSDKRVFCEKLSLYWKNKNRGLIIFLDNMDQLSSELQDVSYLIAVEIAKKLSCLVIISMREERFYNAKTKGVLDAYHTPGFHLTAPLIPEVINKRIEYILEKLKYTVDVESSYNINSNIELLNIESFFKVCFNQLKIENSHLNKFLRFATHGDVRQALEFFKGFITSGYINIDEISSFETWYFQIHQVIKPMMVPDRMFYNENLSKIPNLLKLRNDINSSHFTGLRILNLLSNSSGFIDAKYFLQEFENRYFLKDDCEQHLNILINRGLIEASNRLEEFNNDVDQIKITAFGNYLYEHLAFNFAYLELVCIDCGGFSEELCNYLVKSANDELKLKQTHKTIERIQLRIERVDKFLEYLCIQENEEFESLNLDKSEINFSLKMKISFDSEKERILESANKNKKYED